MKAKWWKSVRRQARSRWRMLLVLALLVATAVGGAGVHVLGDKLLVPRRRTVEAWHRQLLDQPAHHGMVIDRFSTFAVDGTGIEALLIRPSREAGQSRRHVEMRRRLGEEAGSRERSGRGPGQNEWAPVRGTVVLLHGRSGIKEDGLTIAERFAAVGFATVLVDSRAHGESPAETMSYGYREVGDLRHVIDALQARYDQPGDAGRAPLLLWGNSMGAAVAIQALPSDSRWRGAVVVAPFADLGDLTQVMIDRRLPIPGLAAPVQLAVSLYTRLRDGFDASEIRPEVVAEDIRVPVMVVHGDRDGVIPIEHGRRVFAAIGDARKRWREMPGSTHGSLLLDGGDDLYEEMIRFYLAVVEAEREVQSGHELITAALPLASPR